MKGTYLGEFQEIVLLTVVLLGGNAYGVLIQQEITKYSGRTISRGALHSSLSRLEEKGYLTGKFGEASKKRGGKRKKFYQVTQLGQNALDEANAIRQSFQIAIQATRS